MSWEAARSAAVREKRMVEGGGVAGGGVRSWLVRGRCGRELGGAAGGELAFGWEGNVMGHVRLVIDGEEGM